MEEIFLARIPKNRISTTTGTRPHGLFGLDVALRVGSFEVIKETVRSGLGFGVLPEFMVQREIRTGVLAEILARRIQLSANIILIERHKYTPTPTVLSVKAFIENKLRS